MSKSSVRVVLRSVMVGVRVSKSSVRVLDLVTFLFDLVTDLVTFPLDLVTFSSLNRDDKFLCLVIIHKCDIDIFVQCTSDAATHTSVWQQVYGIVKKEHIARHGSSCVYLFQYIVHHSLIHSLFNKSFTSTFSKSEISDQAVNYIWERFTEWAFTDDLKKYACERTALLRAMQHRPIHAQSDAHKAFLLKLEQKKKDFLRKWGNWE